MRSVQLFRKGNAIRVFRSFWDSAQKFGKTSVNDNEQECVPQDPYDLSFSLSECDQITKVTVIGAAGRVGKTLSLLLKTCPLIDHLCLFDTDKSVKGVGVDISHIDTKCKVSYVCGMRNIKQALDSPDVVIIAAGCPSSPHLNDKKLFEKNAPVVAGLSEACARFCPRACIVLITNPINSLLPVVGGVFEIIANRIPSRKLFGLTTLDVVRANTFVAEAVRKDPNSVIVPVIGGTSQETLVPVISQMKPCCKIKRGEMVALTECLKRAEGNLVDCQNCGTRGSSSLSTAYAGFRFTTSLVMALKGAENIIECAFVKSDIIPELEYLASPLKLGIRGIEYNFGYPPLSDYELAGLEQSAAVLMSDIKMGKEFVSSVAETIQEGIVWKRLTEDSGKPPEETTQRTKESAISQEVRQGPRKRRNDEKKKFDNEKSLEEEELLEDIPNANAKGKSPCGTLGLLQNYAKQPQHVRGYHTMKKQASKDSGVNATRKEEEYRRYLMEDRKKTLIPIKQRSVPSDLVKYKTVRVQKRPLWSPKSSDKYKDLNASAKQKLRSYNSQKKFMPSASALVVLDKKTPKTGRNPETEAKRVFSEGYESKIFDFGKTEEEDEMGRKLEEKQLLITKEREKYREYIYTQLQELKMENEKLKKRLVELSNDKALESALYSQNEDLELERTKLKACWLIMSSTMDAFSNFCKKFISKTDNQLMEATKELHRSSEDHDNEDDESGDAEFSTAETKKMNTYDKKYFRFLEKLMEDQMESQLETEKRSHASK